MALHPIIEDLRLRFNASYVRNVRAFEELS